MPANPWELRADVRPLDLGAQRWDEIGALLTSRGDELVSVARRATEGWDAAAADSYEVHRRQVLAHLDHFTNLAAEIAGSLRAVSSVLTTTQKELDQAWIAVATIPHEVVGESRHLVFHPVEDDDRGKVTRGQTETDEIRRRLTLVLDQESTRLRSTRAELSTVRSELTILAGGTFPEGLPEGEISGVGTVAPSSTSVPGSAQSGIAALPPIGSISVSMPHLTGISSAALAPLAATAASGLARAAGARATTNATPPMGGMGGGGMGARGGSMSKSMASGRAGSRRLATPKLSGSADDEDGRASRDRGSARKVDRGSSRTSGGDSAAQTEKEAKRAALAAKRAERAARRAERESEHDDRDLVEEIEIDLDDDADEEAHGEPGDDRASEGGTDADGRAPRR